MKDDKKTPIFDSLVGPSYKAPTVPEPDILSPKTQTPIADPWKSPLASEGWVSPLPALQGTAATNPDEGWVSPMPHLLRDESQATGLSDLMIPKTETTAPAGTPYKPSYIGELQKGIMQGLYQMKEMGGGLLALTGEALKSASTVMDPISEPIKGYGIDVLTGAQKDMEQYQGAIPSYKNISGVQDALHYLSHGVGTLLPMVGMSMVSGGIGAAAGKAIAKNYVTTLATQLASRGVAKEAINEAVKQGLLRGLERGALLGGYASSLAMEAGSITADVAQENRPIEPARIMAGALPAAALDVLPEFSLMKRTGILQRLGLSKLETELTEEAAKKVPHSFLGRVGKEAGKQFLMEAPTEAMQSVLERWAERKDLTSAESIDDYIDSFLIGGAGGALFGGLGGAFEKKPAPKETRTPQPGLEPTALGVATPPEIPPPAPPAAPAPTPPAQGPAVPPITPEVTKPAVEPQEGQKPQPPSPYYCTRGQASASAKPSAAYPRETTCRCHLFGWT